MQENVWLSLEVCHRPERNKGSPAPPKKIIEFSRIKEKIELMLLRIPVRSLVFLFVVHSKISSVNIVGVLVSDGRKKRQQVS